MLTARKRHGTDTQNCAQTEHGPRAKPAPQGTSKGRAETTVSKGSLYSVPKTQATSVLPVAREESQRLSAPDFPEHGVRDFQAVPMDCGRFRQTVFQNRRTRSPWFTWIVGPGHEPLNPQQSIVFQGAIFRFAGSAVSWNTLTPLSIVKDRACRSGLITFNGVELLGRSDARFRFTPSSREGQPRTVAAPIALWINVRHELMVPRIVSCDGRSKAQRNVFFHRTEKNR